MYSALNRRRARASRFERPIDNLSSLRLRTVMSKKEEHTMIKAYMNFLIFFIVLMAFPAHANITIDPNGVLPWGTTVKVVIRLPDNVAAADMEIVRDANNNGKADTHEERLLSKKQVRDGSQNGVLKDRTAKDGVIVLNYRIATHTQPGRYILRAFPGPNSLPFGVVMKIVEAEPTVFDWISNKIRFMSEVISDPAPLYEMARSKPNNATNQRKGFDLWVLDAGSFEIITNLTKTGDYSDPAWSPDGKKIVCIHRANGQTRLMRFSITENLTLDTPVQLLENINAMRNPAWSPDGRKIAFISNLNDKSCIQVIGADGKNQHQIVEYDHKTKKIRNILAWSKDSRHIFYSLYPAADDLILTEDGELCFMKDDIKPDDKQIDHILGADIETLEIKPMQYDRAWQWLPYASPDGKRLAVAIENTSTDYDLWIREGQKYKNVQKITNGDYMDTQPSWSPDGRYILFVSDRPPEKK